MSRRDSGVEKNTISIMVDQLNSFASDGTWVAREVPEDRLGVRQKSGAWQALEGFD